MFFNIVVKNDELRSQLERCENFDRSVKFKTNAEKQCVELFDETDKVRLCDAVLKKPFHLSDLIKIINSEIMKFRRSKTICIGDYEFDYIGCVLCSDKEQVFLTDKESELIRHLVDVYPKSLEKQKLLQKIWGYSDCIDTHTLETHVYRLRKKIKLTKNFIITNKDGYKLGIDLGHVS